MRYLVSGCQSRNSPFHICARESGVAAGGRDSLPVKIRSGFNALQRHSRIKVRPESVWSGYVAIYATLGAAGEAAFYLRWHDLPEKGPSISFSRIRKSTQRLEKRGTGLRGWLLSRFSTRKI